MRPSSRVLRSSSPAGQDSLCRASNFPKACWYQVSIHWCFSTPFGAEESFNVFTSCHFACTFKRLAKVRQAVHFLVEPLLGVPWPKHVWVPRTGDQMSSPLGILTLRIQQAFKTELLYASKARHDRNMQSSVLASVVLFSKIAVQTSGAQLVKLVKKQRLVLEPVSPL